MAKPDDNGRNPSGNPPIHTEVVTITPTLAKEWLAKRADRQRRLSGKDVKDWAAEMLAGNWRLTGETIKFGPCAAGGRVPADHAVRERLER